MVGSTWLMAGSHASPMCDEDPSPPPMAGSLLGFYCCRSYIKSEAVLKIMEYIDMPFPQLALFLQFVPL